MNPEYATLKDHEIEQMIAELQQVQKRNPPTSNEWQQASVSLAPLFKEMASRQSRSIAALVG